MADKSQPYDDLNPKTLEQIDTLVAKHADALEDELRRIAPGLVAEIGIRSDLGTADHFSDWHDSWRDKGGGWSKTWGKAGEFPKITGRLAKSRAKS